MATNTVVIAAIRKLADTIEEAARLAGPLGVPSGHVYALVMSFMTLDQYTQLLSLMEEAGRITVEGNCIKAGKAARRAGSLDW